MSFSFLLLNQTSMFSFLPKADFVHLSIHLDPYLSLLLINIGKALAGQGPHMNIFTLETVTATISPPKEPQDLLFSETTKYITLRGEEEVF